MNAIKHEAREERRIDKSAGSYRNPKGFDGYGLQRVPDVVQKDAACKYCGNKDGCALFTQKSIVAPSDANGYRIWFNSVRLDCVCEYHARIYVLGESA